MMYGLDEIDEIDRDALIAQARAERLYTQRYLAHPDCRDPDHPGCKQCMEDEDES